MQLIQVAESVIPEWCKDFPNVFSKKIHDQLPSHHPYNHTIELHPDFIPKIAKVYSLNPVKMKTCKNSLKNILKQDELYHQSCYASQQTNVKVKILTLREVLMKRLCVLKARQWFGTSDEGLSHNLDELQIH